MWRARNRESEIREKIVWLKTSKEGEQHTAWLQKRTKHSVASIDLQPDDRKADQLAVAHGARTHTHAALCQCHSGTACGVWTAYVCTARAAGTRASTVIQW